MIYVYQEESCRPEEGPPSYGSGSIGYGSVDLMSGTYTVYGLAPGSYYLQAWNEMNGDYEGWMVGDWSEHP